MCKHYGLTLWDTHREMCKDYGLTLWDIHREMCKDYGLKIIMPTVCEHPTVSKGAQRKQWEAQTHYDVVVTMLL